MTVNARASCARDQEFVSQRPLKSFIALQMVRHLFNIYAGSCVALRYDVEMGTANSLHTSAQFGEYNKRFGFSLVQAQCFYLNLTLCMIFSSESIKYIN